MNQPPAALQPGSHITDLQINAVLGVGAFGITYLVTDPAIGTRFALKEYLPSSHVLRHDDGFVEPFGGDSEQRFATGLKQFLHEARMVAALDHPNIVKVLRYFEANGTAYFLMPYYQGMTLDHSLESNGTLGPEDARAMLLQLMEGLEYLHEQGIIHQDIKPANIYLTEDGTPILLDFGVAASQSRDLAPGAGTGSEGYAAPEQHIAGGSIGPWTDIYSLAATIYRCITGVIPVTARDRQNALQDGAADPLKPFSELVPAEQYGGVRDAVDQGLETDLQARPVDVAHWKKSFKSLDWRRTVAAKPEVETYPKEGKEWLPRILLSVFVVVMSAIGIFLLTERSPDDVIEIPDLGGTVERSSTPDGVLVKKPTPEETTRWQAALQADTIDGYRRFIADYPQSIFTNQAETQLDILDEKNWEELSAEDSIEAYEHYLELFPDGIHQTEAMVRIDEIKEEEARKERERLERERQEQQAWETAQTTRTVAAFDHYIAEWPSGVHIDEANRIRQQLLDQANDNKAFESAKNLNTKDAFQAYIDAFPHGVNVAAALEHLDRLDLRPGKTFKDCKQCPTMMVVPAGTFWQGSEESSPLALSMEKPRRQITINMPFAVGVNEITMAQWDACFNEGGCSTLPTDNGWGRADRPVMMVSFNDAQEYVRWISEKTGESYRLPSESEWEYFARAGEEGDWPGGNAAALCEYGNVAGNETGFKWQHQQCGDTLALGTAPARSFRPNSFGLYDTIGNVSEWTADCMNLSYLDAPVDGSAWGRGICSSHMTRGGSWITGSKEIRLPARFNLKNGDRNDFTGFRVVRTVEQ